MPGRGERVGRTVIKQIRPWVFCAESAHTCSSSWHITD